jgi:acetyl-CoA C-acetyltransferase
VDEASGRAEVETFMLLHDREGKPVSGVVVGRLDNRARFLARPVNDIAVLEAMTKEEVIGKRGKVRLRNGFNVFEF